MLSLGKLPLSSSLGLGAEVPESFKVVFVESNLRNVPDKKWLGLCILGITSKIFKSLRESWNSVS